MKLSPLVNLDFEQIKLQLKYFLKNNTKFTDYDYEGSNINQLLDVLSYTTFLNNFQLNLGLVELNLETATLRDNVTSKSQELGYTPNNYNSAQIVVNLNLITPNNAKFVEIPAGMLFIGTKIQNNIAYKFNTIENIILPVNNGVVNTDINLYEGTLIENIYTYSNEENDRIIITNDKIDLNTIVVYVNERKFYKYENLITDNTEIFYTNIIQDNNIEIEFGKNIFGTEPNIGDVIKVSYLTNNGTDANDISVVTFVGECKYYYENANTGTVIPTQDISFNTISASSGGTEAEKLSTIKFNAIKHYAAQNRAIVATDYESIVKSNFPYVDSVTVIGGETLFNPQYGKVKLIIKTKNNNKLNLVQKNNILLFLKKYNITTIPIIEDAKYSRLKIKSYIKYDLKLLTKNIDELRLRISKVINDYVSERTNDFAFYGHKLESLIYSADKSILSVKIKLVIVDTVTKNSNNFYGNIGSGVKNDNCKLYSLLSVPFLDKNTYYRLSVMGDNSNIIKQKYTFSNNTYMWENDSVVGQLNANTGIYNYTTEIGDTDITIISIPADLDVETTDTILIPDILTPDVSTTDTTINYDISTEQEYKEPTININTSNIDTVSIEDTIPIVTNIIC